MICALSYLKARNLDGKNKQVKKDWRKSKSRTSKALSAHQQWWKVCFGLGGMPENAIGFEDVIEW